MWCFDPTWNDQKFGILKSVQFRHICVAFRFWSNFGWPKIWVIPCWVTTPCGCHWLHLTNSGRQFQQWSLFTFKQYCLEGILAKESSPRTKDFLLWRDLQEAKVFFDVCCYSVWIINWVYSPFNYSFRNCNRFVWMQPKGALTLREGPNYDRRKFSLSLNVNAP